MIIEKVIKWQDNVTCHLFLLGADYADFAERIRKIRIIREIRA